MVQEEFESLICATNTPSSKKPNKKIRKKQNRKKQKIEQKEHNKTKQKTKNTTKQTNNKTKQTKTQQKHNKNINYLKKISGPFCSNYKLKNSNKKVFILRNHPPWLFCHFFQ